MKAVYGVQIEKPQKVPVLVDPLLLPFPKEKDKKEKEIKNKKIK